jgi:RimJ/RimL family protein N-acetyltransferase
MTLPWPYTLGDASAFVGEYGAHAWESGSEFSWAIREIDEGPLLGMIGYRTALSDVGFWLGKPHHGKGMMSAAVRLVAAKLFDMGITSEIGWECVVGNLASMAVARKSGFAFTGIDPRGLRHATGRIRNPGMQC